MTTWNAYQGSALSVMFLVRDDTGSVITTYAGTETLTTEVWAGGPGTNLFSPATAWASTSPADGKVRIAFTAAQITGLAPGIYEIYTKLIASGQDPVPILFAQLNVIATPDG